MPTLQFNRGMEQSVSEKEDEDAGSLTSKWQHLAVGVLLSLCLAGSVSAQISGITDSESQTNLGGMNSIVGTVFAPSGRPMESRVRIRLSTMTRGDRIFTTNQNGSFAFRGLPAGSYTVVIDKEVEYKPVSQTVDIIQFRGAPAQTYTLNIRLEFKERTEAEARCCKCGASECSQRKL